MRVLLCDPSLREFGWGVVEDAVILESGCIKTETSKDKKTLKQDDTTRRVGLIARELLEIIDKYQITECRYEIPVGSKSASAVKALALIQGLMIGLLTSKNVEFSIISPRKVKLLLTGNNDAEKEDVLEVVKNHYTNFSSTTKGFPKYKLHAISDALAVGIAIDRQNKN